MAQKKLTVAVLMGGPSAEHDVSLATGKGLLSAVSKLGHRAVPILISKDGEWSAVPINRHTPKHAIRVPGRRVTVDVALIGLHGTFGEDGQIQTIFDLQKVPYSGSGALASALAMDKYRFKCFVEGLGLRVARGIFLEKGDQLSQHAKTLRQLGWPLVVKPNAQGSSVGVAIVDSPKTLKQAVRNALRNDSAVIIEEYLGKRELTIPTLGNKHAIVFPVIEIIPTRDAFFTYTAKYDGSTIERPAKLPATQSRELQQAALKIHQALGGRGALRTDFFLHHGKMYVIETNTLPGMTPESIIPRNASSVGLNYEQLVQKLILLALDND